ncbi:hypothetical protein CBL_00659 [Carabus blaptoides fortunei]
MRSKHQPEDDEKVWRAFVREQRKDSIDGEISAEGYYELWKTLVNDPVNFNQNIRKWNTPVTVSGETRLHPEV